ncbi:MAG: radical SAM protein [Thermoplasmata archaeon]
MVLPNRQLVPILERVCSSFPGLQRVGIYANACDILNKSTEELEELRDRKLGIIYMGLESGSDEVLRRAQKGATVRDIIGSVKKAQGAGIKVSVIALVGLGGKALSHDHAVKTGRAVSEMDPLYFSLLTLMLVPGTRLHAEWQRGEFEIPEPMQLLKEVRTVIENLEGLSGCIFRTNHASNYVPLAGRLPQDKERLLAAVDSAISLGDSALRPEVGRALSKRSFGAALWGPGAGPTFLARLKRMKSRKGNLSRPAGYLLLLFLATLFFRFLVVLFFAFFFGFFAVLSVFSSFFTDNLVFLSSLSRAVAFFFLTLIMYLICPAVLALAIGSSSARFSIPLGPGMDVQPHPIQHPTLLSNLLSFQPQRDHKKKGTPVKIPGYGSFPGGPLNEKHTHILASQPDDCNKKVAI